MIAIEKHCQEAGRTAAQVCSDYRAHVFRGLPSGPCMLRLAQVCIKEVDWLTKGRDYDNASDRNAPLRGKKWHSAASRIIKHETPSALTHSKRSVARGPDRPKGGIITDPREIDDELHLGPHLCWQCARPGGGR